jgi:hypothetical protein
VGGLQEARFEQLSALKGFGKSITKDVFLLKTTRNDVIRKAEAELRSNWKRNICMKDRLMRSAALSMLWSIGENEDHCHMLDSRSTLQDVSSKYAITYIQIAAQNYPLNKLASLTMLCRMK